MKSLSGEFPEKAVIELMDADPDCYCPVEAEGSPDESKRR